MRKTALNLKLLPLCLAWVFCLSSLAEDYTFQGGSLVIPMDKLNQNSSQSTEGNGIFQAYGLVMELLQQGVTVFWVIDSTKTSNDQPDFTLQDGTLLEVVRGDLLKPDGSPTLTYAGGPFVIDANIQSDITKTLQIRDGLYPGQASASFDSVVIHQVNESFSAPVGQLLASKPPKIALLDTGDDNLDTLLCYLAVAGIPSQYYGVITPDDLSTALVLEDYYVLWVPHWDNPTIAQISSIKSFMDKGGDVLAMCNSIDAFEDSDPIMVNTTMARNGATHNGIYADYRHFDITPSQIGDFLNFTPDAPDLANLAADLAAHTFSFRHAEDTLNWQGATNVIAWDNFDATIGGPFTEGGVDQEPQDFINYGKAWAYFTYRKKDADPEKGDIFYLGGHSYASCFGGGEGTLYRLDFQMSRCRDNGNRDAFWSNPGTQSMTLTLDYTVNGVPGTITFGPLEEDTFYYDQDKQVYDSDAAYAIDDYLEIYTIYGTGGIRTNFGPGCQGSGGPQGTDQLDGIFVEKVTSDVVAITKATVSWDCGSCPGNNYHLDRLTVKVQGDQQCGTPYLVAGGGGHLYSDPGNGCDPDETVEIVPNGFSVSGDGSNSSAGQIEDIAGIRYILNTLLPGLGSGPEFGRSTPIATDDGIYFGTFTFPGNLGHFRKWIDNEAGDTLTPEWDAAAKLPGEADRNLFTFVDNVQVPLTTARAADLLPHTSPDLVVADVEAYVSSFRSQALGGIEKSSAAIVTSNQRINNNRKEAAYIATTYGLMEIIEANGAAGGTELGGYMPKPLLSKLKFTGRFNALRPILNSSPTARDVYLPINGNYETREWRTYLALSLHPESGFEVLDITDPLDIQFKWNVVGDPNFGNASRIAIAQYRKEIAPDSYVLGYAMVAATSHPDGAATEGIQVHAYDLESGDSLWSGSYFSSTYTGIVQNVSDTPPFVTLWDTDQNGFDDRIIVTDLMGRIWELDMETGKKPLEDALPESIFNFSNDGKVRPIGAAPAIGRFDSRTVIGVGTGGVDWSPSDTDASISNKVSVLDLTTRNSGQLDVLLEIDIGRRKLYSPVVFAGGFMYFIAVSGDLNSPDPRDNLVDVPELGDSELYLVNLTSAITGKPADYEPTRRKVSKGQSSIYIKNGQAHISGLDGKITRLGKKKEQQKGMELLDFMLWRFGADD